MRRNYTLIAVVLFMLGAFWDVKAQTPGLHIESSGKVGIGSATPTEMLDVRGNVTLSGALTGDPAVNGGAAVLKGQGTGGSAAVFSLKYDSANFGNTPSAIQILNTSTNVYKTFVIDHPIDPARYLIHATLEGPEGAVFYRGTARLQNGRAEVVLPAYFESLTHATDRTVLLTNIDGFDRLAVRKQGAEKIVDGKFTVISDNPDSSQEFDWEIKAVRKDRGPLVVEPSKRHTAVAGFGPYTFTTRP